MHRGNSNKKNPNPINNFPRGHAPGRAGGNAPGGLYRPLLPLFRVVRKVGSDLPEKYFGLAQQRARNEKASGGLETNGGKAVESRFIDFFCAEGGRPI
jgi:hypothetical protein